MKARTFKQDKINLVTLGCSKNLVDSENIITQLRGNDFSVVHDSDDEDANIIIINTCGFIDVAKEESVNTILEFAAQKKEKVIDKLYVTGCLSQRYKEDLERDIPEVDAFFGTLELPNLLAILEADYKHELLGERLITTPPHYAYLKIAEGCNRSCSFCAIPDIRGGHISQPIESLVKQTQSLAKRGVKEILLIAQELTYYGIDIYQKRALPKLLDALCEVNGIEWIRLHYAYPSKFPTEIFDVMARQPKICNYLDLPLQHASNAVLKRMKRHITIEETRQLIHLARKKVPNITLRTTMLVGFPGETEEEFEELCDFVHEMKFDRLGVFQYSHEDGTPAYSLVDNVSEEEKAARANRIMNIQQEISLEKNQAKIGKKFKVLFDRKEGDYFIGRTTGDSPEVDNEVLVNAKEQYVRIGDFATILVEDATEFDLFGKVV